MASAATISPPRVGMVATVRTRRGIVAAVETFDGGGERQNSCDWSTRTISFRSGRLE